jgi:hypothetical protein
MGDTSMRRMRTMAEHRAHPIHCQTPAATAAGVAHESLHVCARCGSGRVHPTDWTEESHERWRIALRCPDCEQAFEGVFGRRAVERLDDELDRASAAMLRDYTSLVRTNMSEEAHLLARALALDLIGPEDFRAHVVS